MRQCLRSFTPWQLATVFLVSTAAVAQQAGEQSQQANKTGASNVPARANYSAIFNLPNSRNPLGAYSPSTAPEPQLTNSPDLKQLIRDGELYLSLKDAIRLALENNLDIAIARYNLPIADMDILRTKAGGVFRGVNAGVVQGTPGGGVGGFGTGAPGARARRTTGGAGGAGARASGLVQSTLGVGTAVPSYDPTILRPVGAEHQPTPFANREMYSLPPPQSNPAHTHVLCTSL